MSSRDKNNHYVRRIVLPSGKTIEVVYFEDDVPVAAPPQGCTEQDAQSDLHICRNCGSDLVYPVEWDEATGTSWEVSLRCPNCEWTGAGIFEQDVTDRFDEELNRGTASLVRDLRRLIHKNMEEDIERFVAALHDGHIVPEDF